MKNMVIPTRPAPSVQDALQRNSKPQRNGQSNVKKKPPPRPPPPNFNKLKSKSVWNLNQQFVEDVSLINLSPPESPKSFVASRNRAFGGSVSSSFSSSTSSLASSKKSFEYDTVNADPWTFAPTSSSTTESQSTFYVYNQTNNVPQLTVPTIIRAQIKRNNIVKPSTVQKNHSLPMPLVPPPSPPKDICEVNVAYGIALYSYNSGLSGDLTFQENDVIFLLKYVNNEWYYGRIEDREGMFPASYISVEVPLPQDDRTVTALYEFVPQASGDLALRPGQIVRVTSKISDDWLTGESEGFIGQFPSNFINRIPTSL